jgi:hypothetical protein
VSLPFHWLFAAWIWEVFNTQIVRWHRKSTTLWCWRKQSYPDLLCKYSDHHQTAAIISSSRHYFPPSYSCHSQTHRRLFVLHTCIYFKAKETLLGAANCWTASQWSRGNSLPCMKHTPSRRIFDISFDITRQSVRRSRVWSLYSTAVCRNLTGKAQSCTSVLAFAAQVPYRTAFVKYAIVGCFCSQRRKVRERGLSSLLHCWQSDWNLSPDLVVRFWI